MYVVLVKSLDLAEGEGGRGELVKMKPIMIVVNVQCSVLFVCGMVKVTNTLTAVYALVYTVTIQQWHI